MPTQYSLPQPTLPWYRYLVMMRMVGSPLDLYLLGILLSVIQHAAISDHESQNMAEEWLQILKPVADAVLKDLQDAQGSENLKPAEGIPVMHSSGGSQRWHRYVYLESFPSGVASRGRY